MRLLASASRTQVPQSSILLIRNETIHNDTQSGVSTQYDGQGAKPEILRMDSIPETA
jgi:hypothetical protein